MMRRRVIGVVILLLLSLSTQVFGASQAKILLKVVDEDGFPVEGARVQIGFKGGSLNTEDTYGKTDMDGFYVALGASSDGVTGGGVRKEGYYISGFHHDFFTKDLFGRWQPWPKEVSVVMRPIINPVPMYVRNNSFELPVLGKEIGFDLVKSDWVIPYGQGVHADFIFKVQLNKDDVDNYEAIMDLTFPNPFDGIKLVKDDGGGIFYVGSKFRLFRFAPEYGYQNMMQKRTSTGVYGRHSDNSRDNNYVFRIRSEVDENGNLKRAMYGKIRSDLVYSPGSNKISMHYYLNPDYTRNLEFDPARNLSIVSDRERVEKP